MNGGTCFKIPSVSSPTCVWVSSPTENLLFYLMTYRLAYLVWLETLSLSCSCSANYEGSRCEQYQLFSFSHSSEEKGLIAAVVIMVLLVLAVLVAVIYYIYKWVTCAFHTGFGFSTNLINMIKTTYNHMIDYHRNRFLIPRLISNSNMYLQWKSRSWSNITRARRRRAHIRKKRLRVRYFLPVL